MLQILKILTHYQIPFDGFQYLLLLCFEGVIFSVLHILPPKRHRKPKRLLGIGYPAIVARRLQTKTKRLAFIIRAKISPPEADRCETAVVGVLILSRIQSVFNAIK